MVSSVVAGALEYTVAVRNDDAVPGVQQGLDLVDEIVELEPVVRM